MAKTLLQELITDPHENCGCDDLIFEPRASSVGEAEESKNIDVLVLSLSNLITLSTC